jgi:hypothetical protein
VKKAGPLFSYSSLFAVPSLARSPASGCRRGVEMLSDLRASLRRLRANHSFLPIRVCDDVVDRKR